MDQKNVRWQYVNPAKYESTLKAIPHSRAHAHVNDVKEKGGIN